MDHVVLAVKDMQAVIRPQIQLALIFYHCIIGNLRQHRHSGNIRKAGPGNMQRAAVGRRQPVTAIIILHDLFHRRFKQPSLNLMEYHVPIKIAQSVTGTD